MMKSEEFGVAKLPTVVNYTNIFIVVLQGQYSLRYDWISWRVGVGGGGAKGDRVRDGEGGGGGGGV